MNKKLIAPIAMAAGMLALSVGSTFALFTSKASNEIDINAGKVKVEMSSVLDVAQSRYLADQPFDAKLAASGTEHAAIFENGGTADLAVDPVTEITTLTLDRLAPMDKVSVTMKATNKSNINIKYRYVVKLSGDLIPALQITIDGTSYQIADQIHSIWSPVMSPNVEGLFQKQIDVKFPYGGDEQNIYQEKECEISLGIEAIQGNAEVENDEDTDRNIPHHEMIESDIPSDENKSVCMTNSNGTVTTVTQGKSVAEGVTKLGLEVETLEDPIIEVPTGKEALSVDIDETGLKEENDTPVDVSVDIGTNKTGVEVYHEGDLIDSTYNSEAGNVAFKTMSFSQFDIVWDAPANTSFGFYDSKLVDEGLETEHWEHIISTAEEFRNILDSSVHESKTGRLDYPGAGEKETVYLLRNDIDFGGSCWNTPELLADVKANAFVGVLDTVSGYPITLSNIHVNAKTGSILEESDGIICLFDKVYNAKISNLVLDDMTIDDSTAKVGALLALGNKGVNQEYLELKNITTNSNCHVNIKASAGGIVGVLRNFNDHISFVNCVNNANVSGALTDSGTNIGGIMSQSSLVGDDLEILFENCTNNGDIVGGYCVGGLAGSLSENGAIKNCVNNGDITYTVGKLAKVGKTWTYQVCGSFVGAYAFNSDTEEVIYDIEMVDSLNRGNLFIGNETYPIVDFAYGPTFYEVSDAKVQNPTLEEFKSLFVSKYTNVNIPMSFNGQNKLVIEAPQGVTVAKYVLNLRFATTHVSRSAGKSNVETSPHDLASIEILAQDLATFDLTKINQVGYFAPDETCGVPEYIQSNPAVKTKKDALKYGFIDYSYHGNADLTPGYHENDKGGYIVWDTTGTEGDLYRAPYIWGEEQTCTYNITAYDDENKTVATGTLNGGVIISGIVTYGGTEWHA